ncbi:DMT family transporter [Consotaella salsifontis]|uniref:S-adenosylmethionine uptake transporter n=1 Tax=Consotaella salsifontis TaxID=1365950 RepID=A0A1T4TCC4_9HYPH|nr:DMT family transporter [Consotaella salsifontis]SKA38165.1 S-adenosylmethionine uptake transporter [Consotaella salsifontis]
MDPTASLPRIGMPAVRGAQFMVLAGVCYAVVNVLTQWTTQVAGLPPTAIAFYQYFFALMFAVPWLWRQGRAALATSHFGLHLLRAILSAAGVQTFVAALAAMPVAHVIVLVMTAPFFVVAGAGIFLGEQVTGVRLAAVFVGFCGAAFILEPWSASFSLVSLLPIAAAALWGAAALMTKRLTFDEKPETVTVYLLLLLTPINAVWLGLEGFVVPRGHGLIALLSLGLVAGLSQYFVARAYAVADASYLQPFDDLKLPFNILLGWLVFAYAPDGLFWIGATMILGASLFNAMRENR